eukprot:4020310-Pyramimonas_sp.AAC.1
MNGIEEGGRREIKRERSLREQLMSSHFATCSTRAHAHVSTRARASRYMPLPARTLQGTAREQ